MTRSITFGRGPGVDVVINDEYVSPRHCKITETNIGSFFVQDLGSINGTWLVLPGSSSMLDHVKVEQPRLIPAGARVRIGRTTLPWSAS